MIKKQQKWIALLVVCTFLWLMQVSTMPMAAASTSGQTGVASAEQGPDYVEAVSHKAAPAKKKSILPWILIGVGLLTVTAVVLFLVVLKNYDVTGSWVFVLTGPSSETHQTNFTGTKKSGNWVWAHDPSTKGTYTVDGKNLTMVPGIGDGWTATITGTFTSKDAMSGTWIQSGYTWNWTATRGTSPSGINSPSIQALGAEK
ncbi:MAG: hypothetical protein JXI33_03210 [Candidatus Aminicenantes bacterium]|nr:hypothetical protein [Candidatus Aminicenantes bacterium]